MTDAQGRKVSFKNCVIIMTSNIGATRISNQRSSLGFSGDTGAQGEEKHIKDAVMGELKRTFRPEFLNRVDDIIIFHQLTKPEIQEIARRMLAQVSHRIGEKGITLSFSEEAVQKISDAGFDPVYGARPLRRAIQSQIEDLLSEELLSGKMKEGAQYRCAVREDAFVFLRQKASTPEKIKSGNLKNI